MLEKDDRIGVANGSGHQANNVYGTGRHDDLESWNHHAPVLNALAVLGTEACPAAVTQAHDQRSLDLAVGHVAALGELVGKVVPADRCKVSKHDFGDGLKAGHGRAHGGAEYGLL